MTATHAFDTAIRLAHNGIGSYRGQTTPEYANMVGPFGGVTAAAIVRAIEDHPDRIGQPVALTVNYLVPVGDGSFDIALRAVRTNRTNQHWTVEVAQEHGVTTTATAVFGIRRDAWSDTEATMPAAPDPEGLPRAILPEGVRWMRNYEMRYVAGEVPAVASESTSSTTTLWVRQRPARALDFAALSALSDVFYPRVFLRRGRMLPAGTISLTTYFHVDGAELARQGTDYVLASAHAQRFARGYFDQTAQIWGRDATLLATSHQIVYYKD
ncbi:thioesterase family protein [Mycobacterium sp. CVI_P3]|uniref:Thioesterase family protein n=1 Tax=Mycobacterium pinniadriaticum TaxID=2994102 RepID=A0ABT3SCY1_9MYCO|nr:thioesterase family protein [Mycobacterium pinniadriaticum]MCX2930925.1 thioesterase family protein [Mycobacterium pinniadriaticum]MCX2937349.1 thioesterase family protein [Mycobacterium pinniadriaticum]